MILAGVRKHLAFAYKINGFRLSVTCPAYAGCRNDDGERALNTKISFPQQELVKTYAKNWPQITIDPRPIAMFTSHPHDSLVRILTTDYQRALCFLPPLRVQYPQPRAFTTYS